MGTIPVQCASGTATVPPLRLQRAAVFAFAPPTLRDGVRSMELLLIDWIVVGSAPRGQLREWGGSFESNRREVLFSPRSLIPFAKVVLRG